MGSCLANSGCPQLKCFEGWPSCGLQVYKGKRGKLANQTSRADRTRCEYPPASWCQRQGSCEVLVCISSTIQPTPLSRPPVQRAGNATVFTLHYWDEG